MIKDSKIIGTKIAAPFGWKKFKVGELFDAKRGSRLVVNDRLEGDIPFVTAGYEHEGISCRISNKDQVTFKPNSITIDMFGNVFYRDYEFKADDNIIICYNKFPVTREFNLFIVSSLTVLLRDQFKYSKQFRMRNFDSLYLDLPVLSNFQPDFAWMEQYMKLVQEDYLKQKELSNQAEIKAYLTESHTDSLAITDADRRFLRDFEKLPRRKFKVGELFDVKSTRALNFDELESSGDYPYVVRSAERNGIRDYMTGPLDFLNKGNCITLGIDTASYFYQSCDYFFAGVKVKALYSKNYKLNMNIALYLISVLSKQVSGYGYAGGKSFSVQEFSSEYLELPVLSDSQVDFESIEKYIRIQVKLTIVKRKERLDRELKLMKQLS